ncbi:MAG: hypothetical protein Q8865_11195, partial [Bacillota bacterium]|nr:hypothetical protein [Bacillota bacterium]
MLNQRFNSKIALVVVMIFCFTFPAIGADYNLTSGNVIISNGNELTKTSPKSTTLDFSKKDFTDNIDNLASIIIVELPELADGTLMLGSKEVLLYDPITTSKLTKLK